MKAEIEVRFLDMAPVRLFFMRLNEITMRAPDAIQIEIEEALMVLHRNITTDRLNPDHEWMVNAKD